MDPLLKAKFLEAIAGIESSYGKNKMHKPSHDPQGVSETAAGMWGIKPSEVKSIPQRLKNLKMPVDPEVAGLKKLSYDQITQTINENPELDKKLAEAEADILSAQNNDNLPVMAYKWHKGVKAKAPKDLLNANDGYVGKFVKDFDRENMEKARFRSILQALGRKRDPDDTREQIPQTFERPMAQPVSDMTDEEVRDSLISDMARMTDPRQHGPRQLAQMRTQQALEDPNLDPDLAAWSLLRILQRQGQ